MRDSYRRCLMILGVGAIVAWLPITPTLASEALLESEPFGVHPLQSGRSPGGRPLIRLAQTQLAQAPESSPANDSSGVAPGETVGPTLEPGEEALPLEADSATRGTTPPPPSDPVNTIPQSDRPTEQGFDTPPDYLTPDSNPLLLPTQPSEVEILGTQPISLETAIDLAYRNSEDMQLARLQLENSQAGLRAEQALLYPTAALDATLENTNETVFGVGLGNNATRLRGAIRADYDLGVSGERSARISAAADQVRLAELRVEQTREELRLATATDYYAVQEAIEQIRINQAFLDEAERNLRDTQLREEVGVGTRFDVLRAEVQVANARQTLTQATSDRQIAQRQLARRLNVPPTIDITTLAVNIAGSWPLSLEESIVLAFQNRAELEQFLIEREFNESQRQAQLARVRPGLGLFAQYDAQTFLSGPEDLSTLDLNDGFSVGAQLSWRLYDGGAAVARAAQSDLDIQTDEVEFENTRNDIRVRVEEAYYTLVANQANIDTASVAANQAKEALALATLRFNAGVGTQLDVLSATRELAEAEGNLVSAVLNYNRALASLERQVSNLASLETP